MDYSLSARMTADCCTRAPRTFSIRLKPQDNDLSVIESAEGAASIRHRSFAPCAITFRSAKLAPCAGANSLSRSAKRFNGVIYYEQYFDCGFDDRGGFGRDAHGRPAISIWLRGRPRCTDNLRHLRPLLEIPRRPSTERPCKPVPGRIWARCG